MSLGYTPGRNMADRDKLASTRFVGMLLPVLILIIAIVVLPIALTKIPSSADYVNHLARMYVIAFGKTDPILSSFYGIDWKFIPNLAMDLIVPPLAHVFGIFAAGSLFLVSYIVLVITGTLALNYSLFRRWSLGPLVAALFVYNGESRDGVVNYLFGIGLALWGAAGWVALRQGPPLLRAAASTAVISVLFVCHLEAVGLYGLAILALEASTLVARWRWFDRHFWIDVAVLAGPFLIVPVLISLGPTAGFVGSMQWSAFPGVYGYIYPKLHGLRAVVLTENLRIDAAVVLVIAVAVAVSWSRGYLRMHPAGWFLLATAGPLFLVLPHKFLSAGDVDVRLPIGVLFFWLATLDWRLPTPRARGVFATAILALALVRVGVIAVTWIPFNNVRAELEASLREVPPGSRVLIARPHVPEQSVFGLIYLPCLATIERSSVVSLTFSHPAQQVLTVAPALRPFVGGYNDDPPDIADVLAEKLPAGAPAGTRLYWKDWATHYDFMYLIWTNGEINLAPDRLVEAYRGTNFRLYRIRHDVARLAQTSPPHG